jgi:uncharacterized protein YcbX
VETTTVTITEILNYPVKSCAGSSLIKTPLDEHGIPHDREFVIVDANGKFLTQRSVPKLALIGARNNPHEEGEIPLILGASGRDPFVLWSKSWQGGKRRDIKVFMDTAEGRDCGDGVAEWLSSFLDMEVRLMHRNYRSKRTSPRAHPKTREPLGFQDGYPLLLASEASLATFNHNSGLAAAGTMKRMQHFRPNIVVSGCPAYDEMWFCDMIVHGDGHEPVHLKGLKRCERCTVPDVNPNTGELEGTNTIELLKGAGLVMPVTPNDPEVDLRTKAMRSVMNLKRPVFGMNCEWTSYLPGKVIAVGDTIEIKSRYDW